MEPDLDKIVSSKIRQTELRPVQWNKEAVWHSVKSNTDQKRPPHNIYFAAAAVILLLIYFSSGVAPKEMESLKTTSEVRPVEEPAMSSATSEKPEARADEAHDHIENVPAVPEKRYQRRVVKTPAPIEETTLEPLPFIEPVAKAIDIKEEEEEESLPTNEATSQERKIQPVVGVIIDSYPDPVASAKRKKRLRKLQFDDPTPWVDPGNALVFAMQK